MPNPGEIGRTLVWHVDVDFGEGIPHETFDRFEVDDEVIDRAAQAICDLDGSLSGDPTEHQFKLAEAAVRAAVEPRWHARAQDAPLMATRDPYPLGFRVDEGGNIVDEPKPVVLAADVFKRMIEDQPALRIYCASEAAIIAAAAAYPENDPARLAHALIAAHHPALHEYRSVCLRDVLVALENGYHPQNPTSAHPVDFLWSKFVAPKP